MDKEMALEECKTGWLSVERDFNARLLKPELLKRALQMMGRNPSNRAIDRYWAQAGGSLSFEQFCLVMRREKKTSMSDLMQAFKKIDSNGDGFITAQELQRKLSKRGEKMTVEEVQAIIAEADLNGDGKLDYAEFCHMLLSTSEECTRAFQKSTMQVVRPQETSLSSKRYGSPKHHSTQRRSSFDRRERRREEIRMQLYSYSPDNKVAKYKWDTDGNEAIDQKFTSHMRGELNFSQSSSNSHPEPTDDVKKGKPYSEPVTTTGPETSTLVKLPPLKKVPLPPLLDPPVNGVSAIGTNRDVDIVKQKEKFQEESDKNGEDGDKNSLSNPVDTEKESTVRQTDHLQDNPNDGQEKEVQEENANGGNCKNEPLGDSDDKEVEVMGETAGESNPLSKGVEGEKTTVESGEVQETTTERGVADLQGGKIMDTRKGAVAIGDSKGEEKGEVELEKESEGHLKSASVEESSSHKEVEVTENKDSIKTVLKRVVSSSVIAAPPKKPNNIKSWNTITGKGCFYLEFEDDSAGVETQSIMKSHHYHLKLPTPTNVWVEVGVAEPGHPETTALMFVFKTNEDEEITDAITYTQHKIGNQWICRMDLDSGTYALIPFTSGCHLKPLEEDYSENDSVALATNTGGHTMLTSECQKALEEVFHRIDLDGNGYISRTEFDFFQEVTSGEICDDDAWNIILSNFDVTSDEEITLKGFLALHEMTAADDDGEEELWQVMKALGYNKQLQLNQACPFCFEVFTEDCEGEIEIIDLFPFSAAVNSAFVSEVMDKGVVEAVKGAEQDELATYTFTTSYLSTIVIENKSSKTVHVQFDCSQSVNYICNRESSVHVMEVGAHSSSIGYHIQPADPESPFTVNCTVSKILA